VIWWQDGKRKIARGWLTLGLFAVTVSSPAYSQSCALCYTQAAAATARFIEALRSGILLLIVPPMFLYGGLTVMAYKRRFRYKKDDEEKNGGW
jgi:hypothetical protein